MKMMLMGVMPGLPKMWFPIVDVRDVAQAHLNAIKVPEAANKRFALCGDTYTFKELCEKIIEKYGDKYPTHTREMEECPPENVRFKNAWGHHWKLDNTRSTSILGIKYHDVKDTLVDMTEALISHSMIPDNQNK
jgi:nucleoside-diphosphate-sugar epimerase